MTAADIDVHTDTDFEFDAPQFFNFHTMETTSPSESDAWFDTRGPQGLASPDTKRSNDCCNMAVETTIVQVDTSEDVPMPAQIGASLVEARLTTVEACHAQRPSNLVTTWSQPTAIRVAVPSQSSTDATISSPVTLTATEGVKSILKREDCELGETSPSPAKKKACEMPRQLLPAAEQSRTADRACKPSTDLHGRPNVVLPPAWSVSFAEGTHFGPRQPVLRSRRNKPGAPRLATSSRTRVSSYKGRDQEEAEMMAAMPKFKARPYNPKTAPNSPDKRLSVASGAKRQACTRSQVEAPCSSFKARPLDSRILQGPTFLPQLCHKPPVVPQPPSLATDARGQAAEEAHRRHLQQLEQVMIRQREFHARPAPETTRTAVVLPAHSPILTMPEPFNLQSVQRHEEVQVLREIHNQQEEMQNSKPAFKALPVPKDRPFIPAKSDRFLTVPDDFELPGEVRSRQRAEYDAAHAEREAKRQEEQAAQEAENQRKEAAAVKQLRREMEFQARPMPKFKPAFADFELAPLKWTDPISPRLATEARALSRRKA